MQSQYEPACLPFRRSSNHPLQSMSFIPVAPPKALPSSVGPMTHPRMFIMPDLVSHCTFNLRVNEALPRAVWECKSWMINGSNISRSEKKLNSLHGLKAGGLFHNPSLLRSIFSLGRLSRTHLCMLSIGTPPQTEGVL